MKKKSINVEIIEYIKENIISGKFAPNEQIPTEMELARMFNTSRTTVSKALNDLNIQEYIYRIQGKGSFVSPISRTPKEKNNIRTIALVMPFEEGIPNRNDEVEIIRGIESYLKGQGYFLILQFSELSSVLEKELIRKCKNESVNGVILYPVPETENEIFYSELVFDEYPIVMLDKSEMGIPINCVYSDNVKGGYEATRHLIESGYKDIYFVSSIKIKNSAAIHDRYLGYCKALKEFGREFSEKFVIDNLFGKQNSTDKSSKFLIETIRNFLANDMAGIESERPGIFFNDDFVASYFIEVLEKMDISIPEQVGIVGYGDINISKKNITTIRQNYFEIGQLAAKTVVDKISNREVPQEILVDVELVIRKSSGALVQINN